MFTFLKKRTKRRRMNTLTFYFTWITGHIALTYSYWYVLSTTWQRLEHHVTDDVFQWLPLGFYVCLFAMPVGTVLVWSVFRHQLIYRRIRQRVPDWYKETFKAVVKYIVLLNLPPLILGFCLGWSLLLPILMFGTFVPIVVLTEFAHERALRNVLAVQYWHRIRYYLAWNCLGQALYFVLPQTFYTFGSLLPMIVYSAIQAVLMLWVLYESQPQGYYFPPKYCK